MRYLHLLSLALLAGILGCSSSDSSLRDKDASTDADSSDTTSDVITNSKANPLLLVNQAAERLAPNPPANGTSGVMADLDNDGAPDIVEATEQGIRLWWNDGSGHFKLGDPSSIKPPEGTDPDPETPRAEPKVTMVIAADLQGKGTKDLILLCADDTPLRRLKNQGTGRTFQEVKLEWPHVEFTPRHGIMADFNADGSQDILITAEARPDDTRSTPAVVLFLNDGSSNLINQTERYIAAPKLRAWAAAAGDLDGDGHIDIIFSGDNTSHRILLNDGSGSFRDAPQEMLPELDKPGGREIALGDINGDGFLDILVSSVKENHVLFYDKTLERFLDQTPWVLGAQPGTGTTARMVDMDGDGYMDALVGSPDGRFYVWRNDGKGRWFDYSEHMVPFSPDVSDVVSIAVGDIDSDADPDVFVSRKGMTRPWMLLNWAPNAMTDSDKDSVPDQIDNCPTKPNPDQRNSDLYPFNCESGRQCLKTTKCKLATYGTSVYLLCSEATDWTSARKFCQKYGGDLVIIETKAENDYLASLKLGSFWIGLTDTETEGTFKWVNGTPLATTEYWAEGEPNNTGDNENCAGVRQLDDNTTAWNDYTCDYQLAFVCEERIQRTPPDPGDVCDVCPEVYDVDQRDSNSDGIGDACTPEEQQ